MLPRFFACAALCAAASSFAADSPAPIKLDMKPGLWQNTMVFSGQLYQQMVTQMTAMQKQLEQMPAQQRQMMEQMMAANGIVIKGNGVLLNNGQTEITADKMVHKDCITQAQIDQGAWATVADDCTLTMTPIAKNRYKTVQTCKSATMGEMEAEIEFTTNEHFIGKGTASHGSGAGIQTVTIQMEGQWLGKECGAIVPLSAAAKPVAPSPAKQPTSNKPANP